MQATLKSESKRLIEGWQPRVIQKELQTVRVPSFIDSENDPGHPCCLCGKEGETEHGAESFGLQKRNNLRRFSAFSGYRYAPTEMAQGRVSSGVDFTSTVEQ